MSDVLLVRLSAMGDLVQSLGAVASLRAARPQWRLTLVTQPEWAPLLQGVDGLHRVVTFARRGGIGGVLALRRTLRGLRFDHALDLQGNWKSAFVTRLAATRDRVGMSGAWRQEPGSRVLLRRVIHCDADPHPARAAWELVKAVAPDAPFCLVRLAATAAELEAEAGALRQLGIDPARAFTAVVVTDPADPRALRSRLLGELARRVPQPVAVLGPAEEAVRDADLQGIGLPVVLRHRRGELRRLVALGALLAAVGGEVAGPDQGASHVLMAAGASGRVWFGSQDPHRTAPPRAVACSRRDPPACQPCRARRCANPAGVVCMDFGLDEAVAVPSRLPPVGEGDVGAP
ncbi:MAG: glycosyltransferase family 9 protein [Planctomycetota bacterium]